MIALDLDGVFLSDTLFTGDVDSYLTMREQQVMPIFCPDVPYIIITGRPNTDYEYTTRWVNKNLPRKPLIIYHDNDDITHESAIIYKSRVLRSLCSYMDMTFIESDPEQSEKIKYLTSDIKNLRIFTFSDIINESIRKL